jgi:predicted HicB family RNase H-like nuclease
MIASEKKADVKQIAEQLYAEAPNWIAFYREVLGLRGIVRQAFPTRDQLAEFEQSEAHEEILRMLKKLREQGSTEADNAEPTRVITVRLPRSLHEALRVEAHEHCTSMNKLCISKLLKFIDGEQVPAEVF